MEQYKDQKMSDLHNEIHEAVYEYAKFLRSKGWRTTYGAIGDWMKHSGLKKKNGEPYEGSARGAARVITSTYDYVEQKYGPDQAQVVFYAFCNDSGLHNSRGDIKQYTATGEPA